MRNRRTWLTLGVTAATIVLSATAATAAGTWSSLGTGTSGDVLWLSAPANGVLYAGGNFTAAGGVSASHIAKWNGSAWSALGTGTNLQVNTIATAPDGTLYAGGSFTSAGSAPANYIAKWNGSTWSTVGSGTGGVIWAIAIAPDGTVYAGGAFTTAGGGAANHVAKWNGSSWSALGTGTNFSVWSLAVAPDGTLYAGGDFTSAGAVTAHGIAKWNGTTWSALERVDGTGAHGRPYSLAVGSDGTLYAAGDFPDMDGVAYTRGVAKWNGTEWSALGTGLDNDAESVGIASDGTVYVGGDFTTAGGVAANHIAAWNGSSWSALGSGLSGGQETVWSIVFSPDGTMYAGGEFTQSGSTTVNRVAAWQADQTSQAQAPQPRTAQFTYQLPDGRECGAIGPATVVVGTQVLLPAANADCRTSADATIDGWTIDVPEGFTGSGSAEHPFAPNQGVTVVDSQRFTAVLHEKTLTVTYDANVAAGDPCTPDPDNGSRTSTAWVPRADLSIARTPQKAPCTPAGHQLTGWNTSGSGTGTTLAPGGPLPADWASAPANSHRLYAMWS